MDSYLNLGLKTKTQLKARLSPGSEALENRDFYEVFNS
jgi:hypothetical protein